MTDAWAYLVVSSSPQELSLEAQELWSLETAEANGWKITRTFKGVSSGAKGARPLLVELLAALEGTPKAERPAYVLMVRLDRLGRGTGIEGIAALAEIRRLGTSIYTREDGIVRIERASDAILPAFRSIQAALENEVRSDRAKAGKARRRAAGLHNGNPPYGCILVDGRAVAYEPEAAVARDLFEKRAAGWGYDRLARYAAERAAPKILRKGTRRLRWGASTIQRLLWCRTLRGTAVPESLWDAANAVANPDFRTMRLRSWPFALAGALRCTCGMMLRGQTSRSRVGQGDRYYSCHRVAEHGYYPYWRAERAEEAFVALLRCLAADPALLDPTVEERPDAAALRARESAAAAGISAIEERRRLIWERAADLTGPQLRERLDEIDADRTRARALLEAAQADVAAATYRTESVLAISEVLDELARTWLEADLGLRQESARAISGVVGGLFLEPLPRCPPGERRLGRPSPTILTGFELKLGYSLGQRLSELKRILGGITLLLGRPRDVRRP